jgi:hypothetical protein
MKEHVVKMFSSWSKNARNIEHGCEKQENLCCDHIKPRFLVFLIHVLESAHGFFHVS